MALVPNRIDVPLVLLCGKAHRWRQVVEVKVPAFEPLLDSLILNCPECGAKAIRALV